MTHLAVVTYGNGAILRELLNAVAASMGGSSYHTLIHLSLALAGTWMVLQLVAKRDLMVSVRWMGLYFLAFYVLFLPKATVVIIDRVQQSSVYTVDHVPLGLAVLASYTSVIGDSLTQLVEQNFSMPDDLRYGHTGMVMASQVMTVVSTFQITDAVFQENMQGFINQCVFYDLLLHKYTAQELVDTPDIWAFVTQRASPARAFMYNQRVVTCKDGVAALNHDWQAAIAQAGLRYSARLFPHDTHAHTQLLKYLPLSYAYLTQLSESSTQLMQQAMMANALENGVVGWSARSNAPAALASYAFNKVQQQTRMGNRTVGEVAAYWLPLMKNLFEGILYGAFIFIFLLLLFPFGHKVLLNYMASLLWLQLWSPLYAIINLYVGFYAQSRSLAALHGSSGFSLATYASLAQVNADMVGLAGYIFLSVPVIASTLVYGLHKGFSQVAQYVGGALHSGAGSTALETASGNLSLGNTSVNTHTANTLSANHIDTTARTATGTVTNQMPDGSTLTMTHSGSLVMNNQLAISQLGTSVNLADAIRSTAMQQADVAYSSALSHQHAYSQSLSEAKRNAYELSQHEGTSRSHSQDHSTSIGSSETNAQNTTDQYGHTLTDSHTASESASHNRTETGELGVRGTLGVPGTIARGTVSANLGVRSGHTLGETEERASTQQETALQQTSHSRSVDTVLREVQEGHYRANTESGQRLVETIAASLDRAQQEQTQAAAQFQQAEAYRAVASVAEENAVSINSNATQAFMHDLQASGHTLREIEQIMVNRPEEARALADDFTRAHAQSFVHDYVTHSEASPAHVTQTDQHNVHTLQQQHANPPHSPDAQYPHARQHVATEAIRTGSLSVPGTRPPHAPEITSDLKMKQRTQVLKDTQTQLAAEKSTLAQKVEKKQQARREATSLLGTGINQIDPDKDR